VAISPQTPDNSLTTAEKKGLTFSVLSDVGNTVARQYGLVFTVDEKYRTLYTNVGSDVTKFNGNTSWELRVPGRAVPANGFRQTGLPRAGLVGLRHAFDLLPAAF